jgi:hypothetical protein
MFLSGRDPNGSLSGKIEPAQLEARRSGQCLIETARPGRLYGPAASIMLQNISMSTEGILSPDYGIAGVADGPVLLQLPAAFADSGPADTLGSSARYCPCPFLALEQQESTAASLTGAARRAHQHTELRVCTPVDVALSDHGVDTG